MYFPLSNSQILCFNNLPTITHCLLSNSLILFLIKHFDNRPDQTPNIALDQLPCYWSVTLILPLISYLDIALEKVKDMQSIFHIASISWHSSTTTEFLIILHWNGRIKKIHVLYMFTVKNNIKTKQEMNKLVE